MSSCKKEKCVEDILFEFPIAIYPEQDSLSLFDTIWYEVIIPDTIENLESGELIDVSNIVFSFEFVIGRFDTSAIVFIGQDNFNYKISKGSAITKSWGHLISLVNEGSRKIFKMGIIPKEKGSYLLSTVSSSKPLNEIKSKLSECNGQWTDRNQPFHFKTNFGNQDQNLSIVDGLCQINSEQDSVCNGTAEELATLGSYIFHVE